MWGGVLIYSTPYVLFILSLERQKMNQEIPLKVAHFAVFAPGRSGQYGTVRDLILAERAIGIDAQFIDSETCMSCKGNKGYADRTDGPITTVNESWAWKADVLIRHSIIPDDLEDSGIPIIMCLHGRPENSFLLDQYGKVKVFHFLHQFNNDPRYHAAVTFWRDFEFHFKYLIPNQDVFFVPAMVKLDQFTPAGRKHDFGRKSGSPNIIIADIWREDVTPFNLVFAALKFKELYAPEAKLHIFGLPAERSSPANILCHYLGLTSIAGDFFALAPDMMDKYRAADMLITPHNMATRVVRESLACGCPIVGGTGNPYTQFTADPRDTNQFADAMNECWKSIQRGGEIPRQNARTMAEDKFNAHNAGMAIKQVCKSVIAKKEAEEEQILSEDKKITFAIAAYNSNFIEQVNVLLQSILTVYKDKAKIVFYYSNIDQELIDEIRLLVPNIILKQSDKLDCESGDAEYKTAMKSIVWAEILRDHPELENVVFMDADTLLMKRMGKFFIKEFDVGYCYKVAGDENLHWPINGGVMLIKNSDRAVEFLDRWGKLTIETQSNKLSQQDGYNQWGGGDQVSLGHILGTRKQVDFQAPIARLRVILQGFPMAFFNESRNIKPTVNTHLVHYKGSWQEILKSGIFTPRRPEITAKPFYELYHKTLRMWQHQRFKLTDAWFPEFELEYWRAHDAEFYIKDIERLYKKFNVEEFTRVRFANKKVKRVLEVGGGAFGGELHFYKEGETRILFDYLADVYEKMGHVPDGVKCVKGDFAQMPFPDNSFDVIFACEVLDHALSVGHFLRGQRELARVLRPDGLLFFNHPLFSKGKRGHTIIRSQEEILEGFSGMVLLTQAIDKSVKADNGELFVILSKPSNQSISYEGLAISPPSKLKPIKLTINNPVLGRYQLNLISLQQLPVTALRVQHNPDRAHLYKQLHDGPPEAVFDIMYSPHFRFLKQYLDQPTPTDYDLMQTPYYKMHKLYGKSDTMSLQACKKYLEVAKDIKENGLKFPPLVFVKDFNAYELLDGHHRLAAHIVCGHDSIGVLICEHQSK